MLDGRSGILALMIYIFPLLPKIQEVKGMSSNIANGTCTLCLDPLCDDDSLPGLGFLFRVWMPSFRMVVGRFIYNVKFRKQC